MAIRGNNFLTRTLFFAGLATVFYGFGYLQGTVFMLGLGALAELFFWISLFRRRRSDNNSSGENDQS
ncbi:MAG: hypothetical protein ACJAWF_003973 [Candidatus Azotimanducaceae bacterium]|jgi:hypothetical protein